MCETTFIFLLARGNFSQHLQYVKGQSKANLTKIWEAEDYAMLPTDTRYCPCCLSLSLLATWCCSFRQPWRRQLRLSWVTKAKYISLILLQNISHDL